MRTTIAGMTRDQIRVQLQREICGGMSPEQAQDFEPLLNSIVKMLFELGPIAAAEILGKVYELKRDQPHLTNAEILDLIG
jgi:hypothetical protein